MKKDNELRVIDFFCGAGGFSEGFRQQGFEIIKGVDNWRPAVATHNLNHRCQGRHLDDEPMDVLIFEKKDDNDGIDAINGLPDTEIIIGSPPCVTFSMSNKAGKADKAIGIRLIEAYLRVIAVKKHRPDSILRAWLMENVPNSRNFVKESYSFEDLDLSEWAISIGKDPEDEALKAKNNGGLYTASDFGSPQSRQRFICGEIISTGEFPEPRKTHGIPSLFDNDLVPYLTLHDIKSKMPTPLESDPEVEWIDPNYPGLILLAKDITDHFYDTGVYEIEWMKAKDAKVNHPFMGRMSFPEDVNKPSRTIMATRSASTREAILYRSEYDRTGDGEYRLPTIREAATLMGFSYSYQFLGSEGTKWRLIGNAVCPHMAAALAKSILVELGRDVVPQDAIKFDMENIDHALVNDLNGTLSSSFTRPPKRIKGAKFRMHPFKSGNMTVTLSNYDPWKGSDNKLNGAHWYLSLFLGTGKGYEIRAITKKIYEQALNHIKRTNMVLASDFVRELDRRFKEKIPNGEKLQKLLEDNRMKDGDLLGPITLVRQVAEVIEGYDPGKYVIKDVSLDGISKTQFPQRQLLAIIALYTITDQINNRKSHN